MTSGEIKGSFDLTAVVTANYEFDMYSATGRVNTEARNGEDKHVSILLENTGTAFTGYPQRMPLPPGVTRPQPISPLL